MRLYYIGQAEGPRCYVRSALGVDAERWNDVLDCVYRWRRELQERCSIPTDHDLRACDLLPGRGMLVRNGGSDECLPPRQGAEVLLDGLRRVEDIAVRTGGIEVINVCLRKTDVKDWEKVSLDRLLNRINSSVKAAGRHAFLIFDEGGETVITRAYRRLRIFNPVPSRYELWEEGEKTRNIPIENLIGGPVFRSSDSDYLLQMSDLIAHALLRQEEEPIPALDTGVEEMGIHDAFSILDHALNRSASRRDPQGIVRR